MTSSAKEQLREMLDDLPDDATAFELLDALYIRLKVRRGLADIAAGRLHTQDVVERRYGIRP